MIFRATAAPNPYMCRLRSLISVSSTHEQREPRAFPLSQARTRNERARVSSRRQPGYCARRIVVIGTEPSGLASTLQDSTSPFNVYGRTGEVSSIFGKEDR